MNSFFDIKITKALNFFVLTALGLVSLVGLQACSGGGGNTASVVPAVTVAPGSVTEGATGSTDTVDFTVTLSDAATEDVTLTYSTSDGTATVDSDYSASSGDTLVIPAGQISGIIPISITGDNNIELDETFNLQISNAQNATITGGSQTVAGTILTDDSLAGYYTGGASVNEGMGNLLIIPDGDLQVIVDTDRIVIIDTTDNDLTNRLVYIVSIETFTSQTEFTGTASIYRSGNRLLDANTENLSTSVSGVLDIIDQSLELTLAGTGDYTTGTIDLNYSAKNGVASVDFIAGNQWGNNTGGFFINSSTEINISTNTSVVSTELDICRANPVTLENVITGQPGRIRSFSVSAVTICIATIPLEGYITRFDTTLADDTALFVWFNENGVHGGTFSQ